MRPVRAEPDYRSMSPERAADAYAHHEGLLDEADARIEARALELIEGGACVDWCTALASAQQALADEHIAALEIDAESIIDNRDWL